MGGFTPLGYAPHPDPQTRSLVIQPEEAKIVRSLFQLYDELGCARLVEREAARLGYRTKVRTQRDGKTTGGKLLRCGHIHFLLRNPVYVGRIRHKADIHEGLHPPLIDLKVWDRIQAKLESRRTRGRRTGTGEKPSLLGKLHDETGDRLTPSHANKGLRRYRYYVSSRLLRPRSTQTDGWRLPARPLEQQVAAALTAQLNRIAPHLLQAPTPTLLEKVQPRLADMSSPSGVLGVLESCRIAPGRLELKISAKALAEGLGVRAEELTANSLTFTETFQVRRRGVETRLVIGAGKSRTDEKLIRAIAIAHAWLEEVRSGVSITAIAKRQSCSPAFIRQRMQLAFLSPAITADILAGRQPPELTQTGLVAKGFSTDWNSQWAELGFAERA